MIPLPPMPAPSVPVPLSPAPALPPASPLAAGISESFLRQDAIELARRIVLEIDEPLQLAVSMGLTEVQWAVLRGAPYFQQLMAQARTEATSAAGLADKVRLKALIALDQGTLLDLVSVAASTGNPMARIKAVGELAEIAGLKKQKEQQVAQVGAGPLVQINLPSPGAAPVIVGGGPVTIEADA